MLNTQTFEEFKSSRNLNAEEKNNLDLINSIKKYSVDSLVFTPTKNFTKIFDQKDSPLLWAITASEKFKLKAYYWQFPIVGKVSYKGFFERQKAVAEKNRLTCLGYDVDMRTVTAWSTLGWFSDPVLSSMLAKSKGNLCNLIFHELFHATYYAQSSVDFNENLASFIAHKATLQFLNSQCKNDTLCYQTYINSVNDNKIIETHLATKIKELNNFYEKITDESGNQKNILKLKQLIKINNSFNSLQLKNSKKIKNIQNEILKSKNAYFIDFAQYNGLQDSLEKVFIGNYHSDLKKMVASFK